MREEVIDGVEKQNKSYRIENEKMKNTHFCCHTKIRKLNDENKRKTIFNYINETCEIKQVIKTMMHALNVESVEN